MAGRAAKASKSSKAVKRVAKSLPKTVGRKGPIRDRAKVAQNGPGRGVVKSRMENQAHIAALVDPSTLDEWDDEEVERGYRRDKNGHFTGRPPVQIPTIVHQEYCRRQRMKTELAISKLGPKAARTLEKVMDGVGQDPRAAVAASKLVLDRTNPAGSHDTLDVSVKAEPAYLAALQGAIVIGSADADIIDAEVIEDDVA